MAGGGNSNSARRRAALMAGSGGNGGGGGIASSSTGLTLGQPQQEQHDVVSSDGEYQREDDDSKTGSENNADNSAGEDQAVNDNDNVVDQRPKRKRYHRHSQYQIQEMENFFKECPHPDDKQRKDLSQALGLEPLQIKFWFQNKRTQMKTQHERHENSHLRAENEKLRNENARYREALSNATCQACGGQTAIGEMSYDEHQLRVENLRLRDEIDRISNIAAKYVGKPFTSYSIRSPTPPPAAVVPRMLDLGESSYGELPMMGNHDLFGGPTDIFKALNLPTEADKPMIVELALTAMDELIRMSQMGDPLWFPSIDRNTTVLNEEEYIRTFPTGIGPKPFGFKTEGSKEDCVVMMNHLSVVESLMDVNQYLNVFSCIVSRSMILDVVSTGVAGSYNGALQVMSAEFQIASPLVPTRDSYFARFCKQHENGIWAVVDVALDNYLRPTSLIRCRRRPSGCVIQEMPNGYSKVTWIEHVEVEDRGVHNIFKPLVNSGLAFGAKRWVSTLDRQSQRLASVMAANDPANSINNMVMGSQDARKSLLRLAERMVISFCGGVSASTAHSWTHVARNGVDDIRVMTRKCVDEPGKPPGIVLNAATSFWLPVTPKRIFDFLRDQNTRTEWDILSNTGAVQELAHIANGSDPGNCVSMLRVKSTNSSQSDMLILQETSTDATASYVIYAPIDIIAMNVLLGGGDTELLALLPSGFAILPDGPTGRKVGNSDAASGGSLITVAFQILVDTTPTANLCLGSVNTVNNLVTNTVNRIKTTMHADNA